MTRRRRGIPDRGTRTAAGAVRGALAPRTGQGFSRYLKDWTASAVAGAR
ncbi:hypothetical protein ACTMU2_26225 [Cupriavidus basilensis]